MTRPICSLALWRYLIASVLAPPGTPLAARAIERRDLLPSGCSGSPSSAPDCLLITPCNSFLGPRRADFRHPTLLTMILASALGQDSSPGKDPGVFRPSRGGVRTWEKAVQWGGGAHQWVGELAVLASACVAPSAGPLPAFLRKYQPCGQRLGHAASVGFLRCWRRGRIFSSLPTSLRRLVCVSYRGYSGIGYYLCCGHLNTPPRR